MKEGSFDERNKTSPRNRHESEGFVTNFGYDDVARTCIVELSEGKYLELHDVTVLEPSPELSILTGYDSDTGDKIEIHALEEKGELSVCKIVKVIFDTTHH